MTENPIASPAPKTDLLSMFPDESRAFIVGLGLPAFREKQIFSHLMKGKTFAGMQNLPLALRKQLEENCEWRIPTVAKKQVSRLDGTVKYLFRLLDGACVESVLMQYEYGYSLCISSQVGCRMGCRFCASTLGGKERDLLPSEMLGQIIAAESDAGVHVSHVVMMGIGEPLDNYQNVIRFLRLAAHPERLGLSPRRVSLSTCGIAPKILALSEEDIPVTLSVSLHAATDEARAAIMPVDRAYPIAVLLAACRTYFEKTGRRISFEYTLLSGVNDSENDARTLARTLRQGLGKMPVHVNLIRLNRVEERNYEGASTTAANRFIGVLGEAGITATLRRRLGADIDAACGQLRRRTVTGERPAVRPEDITG